MEADVLSPSMGPTGHRELVLVRRQLAEAVERRSRSMRDDPSIGLPLPRVLDNWPPLDEPIPARPALDGVAAGRNKRDQQPVTAPDLHRKSGAR
jgi:hypothetical protein